MYNVYICYTYSKAFSKIIIEKSHTTHCGKYKNLILLCTEGKKKIRRYSRAISRKRKTATEHKTTWYYCARLQ